MTPGTNDLERLTTFERIGTIMTVESRVLPGSTPLR